MGLLCRRRYRLPLKLPPLLEKFPSTAASHSGLLRNYYFPLPVTSQNTAGTIKQPNQIQPCRYMHHQGNESKSPVQKLKQI